MYEPRTINRIEFTDVRRSVFSIYVDLVYFLSLWVSIYCFFDLQNYVYFLSVVQHHWAKIDKDDNVVDIKETKNIEFGNFNHTMTIYNINSNHNGTYACIATIGARHDMVKWKLIVRGIFYKMVFCS